MGPAFGAPDDKLRDTHQLHFMKTMGFAGLNLSCVIVARMERSEIRDSRDTGPGLRFAPSGLQRVGWVERSDTHQLRFMKTMGFAGLNLSYALDTK